MSTINSNQQETVVQFPDGYKVTFRSMFVSIDFNGKKMGSVNVTHWGPVPEGSNTARMLSAKGLSADDYLFASVNGEKILRATNGVREELESRCAVLRAEEAQRQAEWAEQRAKGAEAARNKCTLTDPVAVKINYLDGTPCSLDYDETEKIALERGKVEIHDGRGFAEREWLTAQVAQATSDAQEKEARKAAEEREKEARLQDAIARAARTNAPVILRSWVTSHCMCGNEDCSFDSAVELVHADGSRETKYSCCH